jgi:hypothetical protein
MGQAGRLLAASQPAYYHSQWTSCPRDGGRQAGISMKLQAAGMIDPAARPVPPPASRSVRPSTHGITWTGT